MDKSNPHKQIEMMIFPQVMGEYRKHQDAMQRAELHRQVKALQARRRRPMRKRLGQWLVTIGTQLQDQEMAPARLDTAEQV